MDEHIKISITDSGIGIESDKFATIFNAFEQVQGDAEQSVLDSFAAQFDPLEKHLSMLKDGNERIKTIVNYLKTSTHMNDEEKTTATITDIIQTTVNLIGAKYKQQIQLQTDFIDHPVISCYPAKPNQVFMNLIVNDCDALLLDENKSETQKQVTIGCRLKDNWVEITFKDNGCGMDESTKSQLFEPFLPPKVLMRAPV
jgi:two-component system NtrC family sensor kinase